MKTFFLILFFSKTILLTPNAINVANKENYSLSFDKPITAITSGASVQIDVSNMIQGGVSSFTKTQEEVSKMFPDGSIEAFLKSKERLVRFVFRGYSSVGKSDIRLILDSDEDPTGIDFSSLVIQSKVDLKGVKIYWKNYQH